MTANPSGWERLSRPFFTRDTVQAARELLGHYLVHQSQEGLTVGRVVEVEAYLGLDDPACHSAVGPTARNAVMFGPAGRAYIYRIYGVHCCFNVTTGDEATPAAVLLRALEPVAGLFLMRERRGVEKEKLLLSGPARLFQGMGLSFAQNGQDLEEGPLFFAKGEAARPEDIASTPRVGISKAADWRLRFIIKNNRFVSRSGFF